MSVPELMPITVPDLHYLRAAQGWIELGNPQEAHAELAGLSPGLRAHPDVLKVRWFIAVREKKMETACDLARSLTRVFPGEADWHLNLANSLYWQGRPAEARDAVLAVLGQFPDHAGLQYNLACYECQLARFQEAKQWLQSAFALDEKLKAVAYEDPDLEPLWRHGAPG